MALGSVLQYWDSLLAKVSPCLHRVFTLMELKKKRETQTYKKITTNKVNVDSTRMVGKMNQSLEGLWPNSGDSNVSSVDVRGASMIQNWVIILENSTMMLFGDYWLYGSTCEPREACICCGNAQGGCFVFLLNFVPLQCVSLCPELLGFVIYFSFLPFLLYNWNKLPLAPFSFMCDFFSTNLYQQRTCV